jgi:hypothetical protein
VVATLSGPRVVAKSTGIAKSLSLPDSRVAGPWSGRRGSGADVPRHEPLGPGAQAVRGARGTWNAPSHGDREGHEPSSRRARTQCLWPGAGARSRSREPEPGARSREPSARSSVHPQIHKRPVSPRPRLVESIVCVQRYIRGAHPTLRAHSRSIVCEMSCTSDSGCHWAAEPLSVMYSCVHQWWRTRASRRRCASRRPALRRRPTLLRRRRAPPALCESAPPHSAGAPAPHSAGLRPLLLPPYRASACKVDRH